MAGPGVVGGATASVPCAAAIVAETSRIAGNRVAILRYCAGMLMTLDKDSLPTSFVATRTV